MHTTPQIQLLALSTEWQADLSHVSDPLARDLIRKLLCKDPDERLSANQASCGGPWLQGTVGARWGHCGGTCGVRLIVCGVMVCAVWYMLCAVWYMLCAVCYMLSAVWYMLCAVCRMACGVWQVMLPQCNPSPDPNPETPPPAGLAASSWSINYIFLTLALTPGVGARISDETLYSEGDCRRHDCRQQGGMPVGGMSMGGREA